MRTQRPTYKIPPFGLRMQEWLRTSLEGKARENERSLNAEIVRRLDLSLTTQSSLVTTEQTGFVGVVDQISSPKVSLPICQDISLSDRLAYSIPDFCTVAGVSRSYIYKEMASGNLPYRKAGKRTLILRSEGERWLNGLPGNDGAKKNYIQDQKTGERIPLKEVDASWGGKVKFSCWWPDKAPETGQILSDRAVDK